MRRVPNLYASAAASIIAFLAFLPGVSRKPLLNNPLEWFPILCFVVLIACLITYGVSALKALRGKGYPTFYGFLLLLGPFSFPAVLGLPNRQSRVNAGRGRELAIATVSIFGLVAVTALHAFGFKIYGAPVMYSAAPPTDEGWIRVLDITKPGAFVLADGTTIDLSPYKFKMKLESMSPEEISEILFNVPLCDLYVKSDENARLWPWSVRVGNELTHAYAEFFPERRYGYYESALSDELFFLGAMEPVIHQGQDQSSAAMTAGAAAPRL